MQHLVKFGVSNKQVYLKKLPIHQKLLLKEK